MTESENKDKTETKDEVKPGQENLDELGYEKPKEEVTKDSKDADEKNADGKDAKDAKVKNAVLSKDELLKVPPASGYDKEPAKVEDPKPDDKKEEAKDDKKDSEYDVKDPGDLLPEEVSQIKEFVKKFKLPKEAADGLVESKKQEIQKLKASMKEHEQNKIKETLKVQRQWYEELKSDKDFGGDKFEFSVKRVDKVLQDFLPNVKNKLTESKGMLPPYIMKDLAKLSEHLYSSDNLVNGEPSKSEKESKAEENDPLAFYNS